MGKKKNLGINAVLNVIKSGLSVLFPLITYPYALRVLGAEGVGKVSYGTSIINYFSLIAMLGVSTYAVREGAKRKGNKKEFEEFVCQVFTINIYTTIFAYLLLIITIVSLDDLQNYTQLLVLQSLSIILTTVGMDWINTIYEDFLLITVRSIVTYVISLILLFLLVRTSDDYYWYAFLTILTNGIICVCNWVYIRKYVTPKFRMHANIMMHLKPLLLMFSNTVAISLYVNFDTTMLGWMKGAYTVGLYTVSVKIYTIVKSMMAAIYAVAIPRLAVYIGERKEDDYKKLYSDIWGYLSLILIPSGVGLICISREIMIFMGGEELIIATNTLQILGVSLVFSVYGGLVTAVLNITTGREKDNLIATILSALINFGLNLIFIPLYSQNGAAITTLISEIFVFVFCLLRIPDKTKYIDFRGVICCIFQASVGAIVIFIYSIGVRFYIENSLLCLLTIVTGSIFLYGITLFILKNTYIFNAICMIKKKLQIS